MNQINRPLLTVVMDGVGIRSSTFGNAVSNANHPNLTWLMRTCPSKAIFAHGTYVGLASNADMGNSEVGHNALGSGRVFDQGAKLVQNAIDSGKLFEGRVWKDLVNNVTSNQSTLHLLGLLSDGNVHSHQDHLHALIKQAKISNINRIRIHVLLDGRDVGEKTAELYIDRLEKLMTQVSSPNFDICIASGGGRMNVTMDRYEADWSMVERGWNAHVNGEAKFKFKSVNAALSYFREDKDLTDQNIPGFVIVNKTEEPLGKIKDGDSVILFNFRGDRAIEISRAFTEESFSKFARSKFPKVYFAGMMQYDGDLNIPPHFLVTPPLIENTLGERLAKLGVRQFACSETQKYGHVTYFWNGNRSGLFNTTLEEYVEVPSDNISFEQKPWMKAFEITEITISRMKGHAFDFGRINYANGDMVGHTGNYEATVIAIETVDLMIGKLIKAAEDYGYILVVTADHGNADEMFDANEKNYPDWKNLDLTKRPKPKTSHTLSPVPFIVFDPRNPDKWKIDLEVKDPALGNFANTALRLMGLETWNSYLPSIIKES